MELREQVPLAPFTTFEIGGAARLFIEVRNADEIEHAVDEAIRRSVPFTFIAGGSNLLIPDEGFDGLVIRCGGGRFRMARNHIFADGGSILGDVVRAAAEAGLTGIERLNGIPGTVGGAVRGNAGAFGTEIKDVIDSVRAYNLTTREVRDFPASACGFSYRTSIFKKRPEWIVTNVVFRLTPGDTHDITLAMQETLDERNRRHIQDIRAAGSFFLNPVAPLSMCRLFEHETGKESRGRRVPAGWLIERTGLAGTRVGGAVASEQHPNYILNDNNACAADVRALAQQIRNAVADATSITLEEEVTILSTH